MKPEERTLLSKLGVDLAPLDLNNCNYDYLLTYTRDKIQNTLNHLETSKTTYNSLTEEGISNVICGMLSANGILVAVPEQFSNGRVDITITAPTVLSVHKFTYLGEAKIWKGYRYAHSGFSQIKHYSTGRHLHASLWFYFKSQKIDASFASYLTDLITNEGGSIKTQQTRYAESEHMHTGGSNIHLDHFALDLFI